MTKVFFISFKYVEKDILLSRISCLVYAVTHAKYSKQIRHMVVHNFSITYAHHILLHTLQNICTKCQSQSSI